MSTEATIWAWKQSVPSSQKIVLLSMADRAGEDFRCWPSVRRLCLDTGLSERTVQRTISELETCGLIRREMRTSRATVYHLIGVKGREYTPVTMTPPSQCHPVTMTEPPVTMTPPPRHADTQNLKENLPRTAQGGESAQARSAPAQTSSPGQSGKSSKKAKPQITASEQKQPYGEFGNVLLTAEEHDRLVQDYGEQEAKAAINFLDLHLGARTGKDPYKSHNLAMRKWVFQKLAEDRRKLGIKQPAKNPVRQSASGKDFFERMEEAERRMNAHDSH